MKTKMRVVTAVIISISSIWLLTGCGQSIPDMTEEERGMVAEYAAGLLLKYDTHYENRLVEAEEREPEVSQPEEVQPEDIPEETAPETEVVDKTGEATTSHESIAEFYGIDGVEITYQGYQVLDSYPESAEDTDVYFTMDATAGNQLLVLKFLVANIGGSEREVNFFDKAPRFRVTVNGTVSQHALTTMLFDDLVMYKGMLGTGESTELVLTIEIPADMKDTIETIALTMRGEKGSQTINLQ